MLRAFFICLGGRAIHWRFEASRGGADARRDGVAARDVLVGEAAEGRPLEVLASEDEVGRRAEGKGRPPDITSCAV